MTVDLWVAYWAFGWVSIGVVWMELVKVALMVCKMVTVLGGS